MRDGSAFGEVPSLAETVHTEFQDAFRSPFVVPAALATNAAVMTVAWFLLPAHIHDLVFSLHGPLAFPVIMAAWMLGDTPSTNVAGWDTAAVLTALVHPAAFRRWLTARCVVLTSLVGVPAAIIALVVGLVSAVSPVKMLTACVVIAILPFGILPLAACVGLAFPYRPQPLRWRWQHRASRRGVLRWLLLVCAPFVVVPLVGAVVVAPSLLLAMVGFGAPGRQLTDGEFVLTALAVAVMALVTSWVGLCLAEELRRRRGNRLAQHLRDRDAG